MKKLLSAVFIALLSSFSFAQPEQFVSLTLCSDRLLIELARPEQISAMSPYSKNPLMMLDKVNSDKPILEAQLEKLLPYADKTLLINETFYPQLVTQLKQLGFRIIPINDSPQTAEQLFEFILQLGEITGNQQHAKRLVSQLNLQNFRLNRPLAETLILSDTGVVDMFYPQYQTLLHLLGLKPLKTNLTQQNFSLEKVLLSQPNVLISLSDKQGYSQQGELLSHPLLQDLFKNAPLATMPLKYTYCFDHGLWQGAERVYNQLKNSPL
ncbi:helical backbone metal receptor [Pasteurellaceae bacterium 15-036681]|nr:helical backbone metal receptor [Pasteurellaceae bacterium 15-036681]